MLRTLQTRVGLHSTSPLHLTLHHTPSYLTNPPSGMRPDVRAEWDQLRQHDVLFLLTMRPPDAYALQVAQSSGRTVTPAEQHGLVYVRGCEVVEVKDAGTGAVCHMMGCWAPTVGYKCYTCCKRYKCCVCGSSVVDSKHAYQPCLYSVLLCAAVCVGQLLVNFWSTCIFGHCPLLVIAACHLMSLCSTALHIGPPPTHSPTHRRQAHERLHWACAP